MPARKKVTKKKVVKKKASRLSRKPTVGAKSNSAKVALQPEYLIFDIPEILKEGSALRLLNVSNSLSDAEKYVESLPGSKLSYYAILEKKSVLIRAPVTTTSVAKRNIVTA